MKRAIHPRHRFALALAVLVVATCAAHSTALRAPFQIDDIWGIVDNATIRTLWPVTGDVSVLRPPVDEKCSPNP